jgi:hypothetical protein
MNAFLMYRNLTIIIAHEVMEKNRRIRSTNLTTRLALETMKRISR